MRNEDELKGVTLLGNQNVKYSSDYDPGVLETFINKHEGREYVVTFDCPEFTTLCPKTGQPDFGQGGNIHISFRQPWRRGASRSRAEKA